MSLLEYLIKKVEKKCFHLLQKGVFTFLKKHIKKVFFEKTSFLGVFLNPRGVILGDGRLFHVPASHKACLYLFLGVHRKSRKAQFKHGITLVAWRPARTWGSEPGGTWFNSPWVRIWSCSGSLGMIMMCL